MKISIGAGVAGLCVAAIALSACSSSASSSGGGGGGGKTRTLGIVRFSGDDVYSNSALQGAADYATKHGWKVSVVDAHGSVDQANSAMTNLVTRGVSALVVSVFPSTALAAGANAAKQSNVPVANWGGALGTGVLFAADTGLGDPIAKKVVADMKGTGELLVLGYKPGLPCQDREKALDDAVKATNIKLTEQQITIPGQVNSAAQATQAWAAAHPKGSSPLGVWSCFDDPATGAVSALQQLGRKDVLTYGLNGTPEALNLVKQGRLTATEWIDGPGEGNDLAKTLDDYLTDPNSVKSQIIGGQTQVVTSENVTQFLAQHPELASK
jgi:ribose transport system substrate-binding protein